MKCADGGGREKNFLFFLKSFLLAIELGKEEDTWTVLLVIMAFSCSFLLPDQTLPCHPVLLYTTFVEILPTPPLTVSMNCLLPLDTTYFSVFTTYINTVSL